MEYIFGANGLTENETLKTKGEEYTDLSGWQETVQEFEDATRTDRFKVVKKLDQKTDVEGNHYTWYEIEKHNTIIDKTKTVSGLMDIILGV